MFESGMPGDDEVSFSLGNYFKGRESERKKEGEEADAAEQVVRSRVCDSRSTNMQVEKVDWKAEKLIADCECVCCVSSSAPLCALDSGRCRLLLLTLPCRPASLELVTATTTTTANTPAPFLSLQSETFAIYNVCCSLSLSLYVQCH